MISKFRWILPIGVLSFISHLSLAYADESCQIVEERHGNEIRLIYKSKKYSHVTINIHATLENMTSSKKLPLTMDVQGTSLELVSFRQANPNLKWSYQYLFDWKPGERGGVHDDSYVYALPYKGPKTYLVSQGYLGQFSHYKGSQDEHAVDWSMPEGTVVCAARGGIVTGVLDDFSVGGKEEKFKPYSNCVIIRHEDGTYAEYCHIKQKGSLVKLNQKVEKGQPIALSGNTGRSTHPHLHFAVFSTLDGKTRKTIPVSFQTKAGVTKGLKEGTYY